jgi:hypothetical protein
MKHILLAIAACTTILPALAQTTAPFVAYDDELKNDWQNWSWAKVQFSAPVGGAKPIKVEGEPWSGLALHHEAFSSAPFTKVSFYINGGVEGGQSLTVKAMADGKPMEAGYTIQPKAKTWAVVVVPLKELAAANKTIDGILLQGGADSYKPYYVTRIQFE